MKKIMLIAKISFLQKKSNLKFKISNFSSFFLFYEDIVFSPISINIRTIPNFDITKAFSTENIKLLQKNLPINKQKIFKFLWKYSKNWKIFSLTIGRFFCNNQNFRL